jgi:hypothetical protein
VQSIRKLRFKDGLTPLVRGALGLAKQGGVALAEFQVDRHEGIEGLQFARVGFQQANMRDRTCQRLLALPFALALLLSFSWSLCWFLTHHPSFTVKGASPLEVLSLLH